MKALHKHAELLKHPELPKLDFSPLHHLLGELMPVLNAGAQGRSRLVQALTQRFGENFRMNQQAQGALKHFDGEASRLRKFLVSKGVRHG